jgi:hypothetical protein
VGATIRTDAASIGRRVADRWIEDLVARRGPTLLDAIVSLLEERGITVELL